MLLRTLQVVIVAAAMTCTTSVMAQKCGCGLGLFGDASYAQQDNCGRGISQQEAEALWANYCHETCGYQGGCQTGCDDGCGCKLGGRLRGMFAGGMFAGGRGCGECGGCDNGCFGYPQGDACGCAGGRMAFGGGMLAGRGCGGCNLGGKLKGVFAGRGCDNQCAPAADCCEASVDPCGCRLRGKFQGIFAGGLFSRDCGGCGIKGRLFRPAVGGDCGCHAIQSCVAGCGTGAVAPAMPSLAVEPAAEPVEAEPVAAEAEGN